MGDGKIGRDPNHELNHRRKAGPHGGARKPDAKEEWDDIRMCDVCGELYPEHLEDSCPDLEGDCEDV